MAGRPVKLLSSPSSLTRRTNPEITFSFAQDASPTILIRDSSMGHCAKYDRERGRGWREEGEGRREEGGGWREEGEGRRVEGRRVKGEGGYGRFKCESNIFNLMVG